MRTWKNVELEKPVYEEFRKFLKANEIKYEPSGCGRLVHVEVFANEAETKTLNRILETL